MEGDADIEQILVSRYEWHPSDAASGVRDWRSDSNHFVIVAAEGTPLARVHGARTPERVAAEIVDKARWAPADPF